MRLNFGDLLTFNADIGLLDIYMDFQDLLAQNAHFRGQNGEKGGAILTPNELVFTFGCSYVCDNFGENRSRNATTDGYTDTLRDANRFYNLSHAMLSLWDR